MMKSKTKGYIQFAAVARLITPRSSSRRNSRDRRVGESMSRAGNNWPRRMPLRGTNIAAGAD